MNGTTERELAEHAARLLASPKGILPESIAREAMAYALAALALHATRDDRRE